MARIVRRRTAEPRRAAGTGPVLPARVRGGSGGPPGPAARQRARGRRRLPQRGAGRRRGPLPRLDLVPPPHRRELTRRDVVGGRGPQRRRCRRRRGLGRGPDRFRGTRARCGRTGPPRSWSWSSTTATGETSCAATSAGGPRPGRGSRTASTTARPTTPGSHPTAGRPRDSTTGTGNRCGRSSGTSAPWNRAVRRPSGARRSFRRAASSRRPPVRRWWTSARC